MNNEKIKEILEKHLGLLSKISSNEELLTENPILLHVITEGLKTIALVLWLFEQLSNLERRNI